MHGCKATVQALIGGLAFVAAAAPVQAGQYKVLHQFEQRPSGLTPLAGLVDVGGTFYGTTNAGGALTGGSRFSGTLFSFDPVTGVEHVLHTFGGRGDGASPSSSLTLSGGLLYGTTVVGGAYGYGTVFSFDLHSGAEQVIHSFQLRQDGAYPFAGLLQVGGMLYGTTFQGSPLEQGTVFSIDPATGTFATVHAFAGGNADGAIVPAGITAVGNKLFGTTQFGGAYNAGTIFAIDLHTGAERVVHSFGLFAQGLEPVAGLTLVGTTLYGTARAGGYLDSSPCKHSGCGTVFAFDTATGAVKTVYQFKGGQDGFLPEFGLLSVGALLYGTTELPSQHCQAIGCGTFYAVDPATGVETVLHEFRGGADGLSPHGTPIESGGTLYGTTEGSFPCNRHCGTVFSFTP